MGDSVFHYTDIDGLVGILSSKSLFATHYNYLNDLNKGEIIRDLIIPILEVDFTQFTQKGLLKANIYERYGTSVHRMLAEIIYDAMRETTNNVSPFFLSSFCEHSRESNSYKNGLLSQWRGYGSAAGFAIEFDKEQLVKIIELEFKVRAYASISSGMVRYSKYDEIFN